MMVTELGMSDLGPIKYDSGHDAVFLGRDYSSTSNTHSGQIAYEIDQQVRAIIDECYEECTRIITENRDKLETIAKALLENETLNGEQIQELYTTGKMPSFDYQEEKVETLVEKPLVEEDPDDDLLDEMK